MSIDKLQQAIALIRSGDKTGGQELLAEVVTVDPGNEMGWLWLASVAPQEKRRFCLEKVLSINPNNAQAKQALAQLNAQQPEKQASAQSVSQAGFANAQNGHSTPTPMPTASPVESAVSATQYWTTPVGKDQVRIILFQSAKLISFDVMIDKVPRVLAQINLVAMTKEWFEKNVAIGFQGMTYKSAPINRILHVRLLLNDIKIEYREDSGEDVSTKIDCEKDEISEAVMESLQNRLGGKYVRISQPTSRTNVAIWSSIILLIPLGGTGFFYWLAQGLAGQEVRGSARVRSMERILQFLGPNGVLCIGGILIIIAIVIVVSLFANPPIETLLVRKSLASAKGLNINPENVQVQQPLAQLKVAEPAVQIPVQARPQPDLSEPEDQVSAIVPQESAAQVAEQPIRGISEYWTVKDKGEVRFIIFQGAKLILFNVMPDRVALVVSKVNQVAMTKEWFTHNVALGLHQISYTSIPLHQISHVRRSFWDRITINYSDETGKNTSASIDCRKYKISNAVMAALQNRLGGRFERVSKSISRWVVAIGSGVALLITYYVTGFFYSLALESVGQELQGRGKALLIDAILKLLGPNGVGCIGLILILLLFCVAALFFANPPVETLLVRKETNGR